MKNTTGGLVCLPNHLSIFTSLNFTHLATCSAEVNTAQVEGEAQGDQKSVQKLVQELNKGPRLAHVTKLEKKDIDPAQGEDHYGVKRTTESILSFD